jgi:hypothetical protein
LQKAENLICVTEDKPQRNVVEGFAQNIKQLESSFQTNKRNESGRMTMISVSFTTARDWHFLREKFHKAVNYHLASNFPKMLWIKNP